MSALPRYSRAVVLLLAVTLGAFVVVGVTAPQARAFGGPVPATDGSVSYSGARLQLRCNGQVPASADVTFTYDARALRSPYRLAVTGSVTTWVDGVDTTLQTAALPDVTVPAGGVGTYRARLSIAAGVPRFDAKVRFAATAPGGFEYVDASGPLACPAPRTTPFGGLSVSPIAVDCQAGATLLTLTNSSSAWEQVDLYRVGATEPFSTQSPLPGTTSTVELPTGLAVGDVVEVEATGPAAPQNAAAGYVSVSLGQLTVGSVCHRQYPGDGLTAGQSWTSPDTATSLVMQSDGNLVLTSTGRTGGPVVWSSGTAGHPGARLVLQGDGNLVVYAPGGQALWSDHAFTSGAYLQVEDDARVTEYGPAGKVWSNGVLAPPPDSVPGFSRQLTAGQTIYAGHELWTSVGYTLAMQADGNLVEHGTNGRAVWNSATWGHPGASATMQADGNLVVYAQGVALWTSATAGHPGAVLVLQDDGNLVIYDPAGRPLFVTGVHPPNQ